MHPCLRINSKDLLDLNRTSLLEWLVITRATIVRTLVALLLVGRLEQQQHPLMHRVLSVPDGDRIPVQPHFPAVRTRP